MDFINAPDHLDLVSMFLLGLLGSGHCVGMCGPLVVAFPGRRGHFSAHLAYNAGRVATYTAIGAFLAGVGAGVAAVAAEASLQWTARAQVVFSLVAALFLALFGLSKLGFIREPHLLSLPSPARIPGFGLIQRRVLSGDGLGSVFLIGLLLGLLPCGLSYAAFARVLPAGGPLEGGLMAFAFGLGTVPSLLAVGLGASRLSARHRKISDLVAGALMIGMATALLMDAATAL
jgi:hypothetical protein